MYIDWSTAENVPVMNGYDVHVWAASMSEVSISHSNAKVLSADESARARILPYQEKRRFVSGRIILRNLLAEYLGVRPGKIKFKYGKNGKPIIAMASPQLHFNMAHNGDLALIAVAKKCFLGIDVEECRHSDDLIEVAKYFFSKNEVTALERCSGAERDTLFFRFWTAKEAYIKAYGGRICDSTLKRLSVCCSATQKTLRVAPRRELRWLSPSASFLAALAYDIRCDHVLCYKWEN
jgi:4'-phosphopantetheinyl transferase